MPRDDERRAVAARDEVAERRQAGRAERDQQRHDGLQEDHPAAARVDAARRASRTTPRPTTRGRVSRRSRPGPRRVARPRGALAAVQEAALGEVGEQTRERRRARRCRSAPRPRATSAGSVRWPSSRRKSAASASDSRTKAPPRRSRRTKRSGPSSAEQALERPARAHARAQRDRARERRIAAPPGARRGSPPAGTTSVRPAARLVLDRDDAQRQVAQLDRASPHAARSGRRSGARRGTSRGSSRRPRATARRAARCTRACRRDTLGSLRVTSFSGPRPSVSARVSAMRAPSGATSSNAEARPEIAFPHDLQVLRPASR